MTATNEMLSNSEIRYNYLIDSIPDVIGELDLDGTISFVSPQVYNLLGYHPDEMIGTNIIKFIHPDDVPVIRKAIKKAIKSKEFVFPNLRLKHKRGNYILVVAKGKLLKLKDKARLIGVIKDVTKLNKTEKKLEESQDIFKQLNDVFLKFKEDPIFNLQLLINTASLLLNADCALFNVLKRVNGKEVLESLVTYNEPPNFTRESDAKGHICTDIIKDNSNDVVILSNLDKTDYIKTDENVRKYDLKQYVSYVVRFNNKPTATFCVVYTENREMSINDIIILQILAKSASTELARWNSQIDLQKSEEKYKSLFEQLPMAILLINFEGVIEDCNTSTIGLFGYTKEEFLGKKYLKFDIFPPGTKLILAQSFSKFLKTGVPEHSEIQMYRKDGKLIWINSYPIVIKIAGSSYILAVLQDITQRKTSEEHIRYQAKIIENMTEGLYLIRLDDGKIVFTNPAFEEMFGYDPGEMIGKNVAIVNAPTDKTPEETRNEIIETLKDTGEWHGEVLNVKKDGTPFWCYANVSFFNHHEYGKVFVSVLTDITERKETKEEWEKFFNLSLHILVVAGFDGTIVRINPGWKEILGYDETDLIGNNFMEFIHPDDREATKLEMEKLSEGSVTNYFENRYKSKDGSYRILAWSAVPNLDKKVVYSIAYDVTEQKRVESKIIASEKKLKELIEAVPIGITISNPAGELFEVNTHAMNMFGLDSKEEYLNTPANSFYANPADRVQYLQLIKNGPIRELELKFKRKNGKLFWGSLTSIAKTVGDDVIFFNTFQDISQRKITEEIIADLAKFPAENPNPVLRVSKEFVLYTNQAGKNLFQVIVGNRIPLALDNYVRTSFNEGKNLKSEIQLNSHIYSIFITPIEGTEYANVYGMNITERTMAEQKLKASEEKLKEQNQFLNSVIESLTHPFIVINIKDFTVDLKNTAARSAGFNQKLFCYNLNHNRNKPCRDDCICPLNEVVRTKKEVIVEHTHYNQRGDPRIYEVHGYPILDQREEVVQMIEYSLDITKRKRTKQKFRETQKKAESYLNMAGTAILALNRDGVITLLNKKGHEILQYDEDELMGKNWFETCLPEQKKNDIFEIFKKLLKGEVESVEYVEDLVVTKTGEERMIAWNNTILYDSERNIVGTLNSGEDITERKISEQKLRESEEKYRFLIETAVMGLVEFDLEENKVSYINPKLLEILGYSKKDLLDENTFLKIIHPEDYKELVNTIDEGYIEFRIFAKDGKLKWLSGTRNNLFDQESKMISTRLWLQDSTESKEVEEIKSNLLTRFSHEFKTPLISIKGFADFLLTVYKVNLDEKTLLFLKRIKDGSDRLHMLINSFVESSQLDKSVIQVNLREENLYDLITEALEELEGLIHMREHEIDMNIDKQLITHLDKEKVYTIITNLLINAINYTPKGGIILIQSKIDKSSVVISIKDNGIGLDENEIVNLFKPFGKIERYGKGWDIVIGGMGMGLFISKEIIELHDGKIWVESEGRNKGSTFYFRLPITK